MAIHFGLKSISNIIANSKTVSKIYNGNTLVYKLLSTYTISVTTTNVTASSSNPTTIKEGTTATLVFTADGTNYKVPTSMPTITGATGTYTRTSDTSCTITLSNPTGNVSFSVVGEEALEQLATPTNLSVTDTTLSFDPVENATSYEVYADGVSIGEYVVTEMPEKGDLITMSLGNATPAAGTQDTYRVLSVKGTTAEVVAMYDQSTSVEFNNSGVNTILEIISPHDIIGYSKRCNSR